MGLIKPPMIESIFQAKKYRYVYAVAGEKKTGGEKNFFSTIKRYIMLDNVLSIPQVSTIFIVCFQQEQTHFLKRTGVTSNNTSICRTLGLYSAVKA